MFQRNKSISLIALFSCLCVFSMVQAQSSETKEVQNYHMTEAKMDQFSNAIKNLADAIQKNPQLAQEDDSDSGEGIQGMVSIIDQKPELKKAIESTGMTSREFVLFEVAIVNGAAGHWVVKQGQKLPADISAEHVQFYQTHEAKFKALKKEMDSVANILDQEDNDDESEDEEDDD